MKNKWRRVFEAFGDDRSVWETIKICDLREFKLL